jgi:hypothetical protein
MNDLVRRHFQQRHGVNALGQVLLDHSLNRRRGGHFFAAGKLCTWPKMAAAAVAQGLDASARDRESNARVVAVWQAFQGAIQARSWHRDLARVRSLSVRLDGAGHEGSPNLLTCSLTVCKLVPQKTPHGADQPRTERQVITSGVEEASTSEGKHELQYAFELCTQPFSTRPLQIPGLELQNTGWPRQINSERLLFFDAAEDPHSYSLVESLDPRRDWNEQRSQGFIRWIVKDLYSQPIIQATNSPSVWHILEQSYGRDATQGLQQLQKLVARSVTASSESEPL